VINHRIYLFDQSSDTAELVVLRQAVQQARDEVRTAKISARRLQKELIRERARAASAERSKREWRRKYKRLTSNLLFRINLKLDGALHMARSLLCRRQDRSRQASSGEMEVFESPRGEFNGAARPLGDSGSLVAEQSAVPQFARNAFPQSPDLGSLGTMVPRGRIAVVLHLYYPELWLEFRDTLRAMAEHADLFVTLTAGYSENAAEWISLDYPGVQILVLENRGRDILPFVTLINSGILFRYELVCKLHTKRSMYRSDGDSWRRTLLRGVFSGPGDVVRILKAFDSDPNLGIVVGDGSLIGDARSWSRHLPCVNELSKRIGISPLSIDSGYPEFPRGSIFWIRASLLQAIANLKLTPADFEPEPLPLNGCMPRAIERLVGHICREAHMRAVETGNLENSYLGHGQPPIEDQAAK